MSTPIIYRDSNINNIPNDLRKEYFERSEQIWIKYDKRISKLCHISKNLYNAANFQVRKEYDEYKHYMGHHDLNNLYHLDIIANRINNFNSIYNK